MGTPIRIRYRPRVPSATLLKHIQCNLALGLPNAALLAHDLPPLAVVAGGPSLASSLPLLRQSRAQGIRILAVNEVPHVLMRQEIQPWAAAHVGPVDLTLHSMGEPLIGVKYFMASTCPPAAFDRLKAHDVVLWHPDVDGCHQAVPENGLVSGGYTIGLLGLSLGAVLGFREIHFYGGDSSFEPAGSFHAYGSVSDPLGHNEISVQCGDRTFATTPELLGQALAFPALRQRLAMNQRELLVHGNGLLPYREACRRRDGVEPEVFLVNDTLQPGADGFVEIEAQMF
jgi:hypothetical protein